MRNVADHTNLADIILVRRLVSLHFLVPLPADAVVTPITFVVPKLSSERVSKGFLRDLDAAETGTRELSGEWVVGTDVWKRLKAERRARRRASRHSTAPLPTPSSLDSRATPSPRHNSDAGSLTGKGSAGNDRERVIYYIHGGAYYVGNAATHRLVTIGVSKACNARVFAITYRLAPEHTFPLPLHDVLQGYLRLLAPPLSIPPENIILAGDSAGGGLCLALCMLLRDEGYQMPAGIILMSPWVDLTMSCGSWDENLDSDVVPRPEADDHLNPVGCYLGPKGIAAFLTHPYASPLFGDLSDLPPMLIQSGDSEVLRDEITLLAHKASMSGVHVTHELYEDMVHVFQMFTFLPATKAAISSVGRWVRNTLPAIEKEMMESIPEADEAAPEVESGAQAEAEARADSVGGGEGEGESGEGGAEAGQGIEQEISASASSRLVDEQGKVLRGNVDDDQDPSPARSLWRSRSHPSRQLLSASRSIEAPDIDLDSLDVDDSAPSRDAGRKGHRRSGSRGDGDEEGSGDDSGSLTPTTPAPASSTSPAHSHRGHADDPFLSTAAPIQRAPRLRRSHTAFAAPTASTLSSASKDAFDHTALSPPRPNFTPLRQRRRTQGTSSLHHSPAGTHILHSSASNPFFHSLGPHTTNPTQSALQSPSISHPSSPTPSLRRRLRSPTFTIYPHPSTRARSQSHSDIFQLVEGYVEGGAANETTVYAPGGEVRSVGVLGEDE